MGRAKPDTRNRKREVRQLNRIYIRDAGLCWICVYMYKPHELAFVYREDASRDHIVLRSQGGSDDDFNVKLAHIKCNNARGDMDIEELYKLTPKEFDNLINVSDPTLNEYAV